MTTAVNQDKANSILNQWRCGERRARKSYGRKFLSLEVGYFWRWLSKDNGETWQLLPHKEYEKIIDRIRH